MTLTRSCACRLYVLLLLALFILRPALAQITNVTPDQAPPVPGVGHDYVHMLNETVNPSNGAVSIRIGTPVPAARGLSIPFTFGYDSNAALHMSNGTNIDNSGILSKSGWSYILPALFFQEHEIEYTPQGGGGQSMCYFYNDFEFQDPSGTTHNLGLSVFQPNNTTVCTYLPGYQSEYGPTVLSGGDPWVQAVSPGMGAEFQIPAVTVSDASGTVYYFSNLHAEVSGAGWASLPDWIEDRNGNKISITGGVWPVVIPDTAGRNAISISGFGTNGNTVTINGLAPYTVSWGTNSANWTLNGVSASDIPGGNGLCPTPGAGNYHPTSIPVVTAIELPNNTSYQFQYDTTTGLLKQITYPNKGYVRYIWNTNSLANSSDFYTDENGNFACHDRYDGIGVQDRYVSFDGSTEPLHEHYTYYTNWVAGTLSPAYMYWSYKTTTKTTYVNGTSYTTVYNYAPVGIVPTNPADGAYTITNTKLAWGSTAPKYSTGENTITYNNVSGSSPSTLLTTTKGWQNQVQMNCSMRTLDNGLVAGEFYAYAPGGMITDKKEYDYSKVAVSACADGTSSPTTTPLRETIVTPKTFAAPPGSIFPTPTILNRPSSVVTNYNGTEQAETDFSYDQTAVGSVTNLSTAYFDSANYGTGYNNRGNMTTKTAKCLQGCTTSPVTTFTYDQTGQALTKKDACGNSSCGDMTGTSHTTTYLYTDNYDSNPSSNTNAYLTKITNALTQSASFKYAYTDGQLIQATDANSQATSYSYNDSLRRLTETNYPDGGETTIVYNDATYNASTPSPSITTTKYGGTSPNVVTLTAFDGAGHIVRSAITSDSSCTSGNGDRTDTAYDGLGRVSTVSNPYCTTGDPTYGITTYAYDPLNRTVQVTDADGTSTILTSYTGRATQVQDEGNGTQRVTRISENDALGRLTGVCEVTPSGYTLSGQNGTSTTCIGADGNPLDINGNGYGTTYAYNVFDDLTNVTQGTLATRSFSYDSLSRLLTSYNPETATITYVYDVNGNLSTRTDARSIVTTYTYDVLNRNTQKSYSDGTQTSTYLYDAGTAPYGLTVTNAIGRLVQETAGCAYTLNIYDPMGRVTEQIVQIPSTTCTNLYVGLQLPYTYDVLGNLLSANDGEGMTFSYTYDGAARLNGVTSNYTGTDYPATLLSGSCNGGACFNALGKITSDTLGDGETETWAYDKRGRVTSYSSVYDGTTMYSYSVPSYAPNSDILSSDDSINSNYNYAYDPFNRLTCTNLSTNGTCASPTNGTPTYTYVYDRFGNRLQQNPGFVAAFSNNRIVGYTYDAAGNLLSDGVNSYAYDAENRLKAYSNTAGTAATYTYDALDRRVSKDSNVQTECDTSGTVFYVYDIGNHSGPVVATETGVNHCKDEIFAGSRHLATYQGLAVFTHSDWLGTERLRTWTGWSGLLPETCTSLPFGDNLTCLRAGGPAGDPGGVASPLHFTGKERDSESGLDNFGARYDASTMGRFMTPDPLGGHLEDPQTLNKYAYVRNNPTTLTDPTGLDIWLQGCGKENTSTCQNNYVGTTDKDGNFTRTHLTGDQTSDATLGAHGISVTQDGKTYEGVWDTNKGENGAVTVAGAAGTPLEGYDAKVTGNCGNTCVASGSIFNASNPNASTAALFSVLDAKGSGYVKEAGLDFIDKFHPGATNFRGHTKGDPHGIPSTHIPIDPKASTPQLGFHIDKSYPYDSPGDFAEHTGSVIHTLWNQITGQQ
jgi:RHS repeat-associated protein